MIFDWYRRRAAEKQAVKHAQAESEAEARRRSLEQLHRMAAEDAERRTAAADAPSPDGAGREGAHRREEP